MVGDLVLHLLRVEIDSPWKAFVIQTSGVVVTGGHIPVVVHTAEKDLRSVGERTGIGIGTIVPFAVPKQSYPACRRVSPNIVCSCGI